MTAPAPVHGNELGSSHAAYPWTVAEDGIQGGDGPGAVTRGDLPETASPRQPGFWRQDEQAAFAEARQRGLGVLIDFYAEWCVACMRLDNDTLTDGAVRLAIGEYYVPLRIDVTEETMLNRGQLQRYRVDQLPAILALDANGKELLRVDAYAPPDPFLTNLQALHRPPQEAEPQTQR